MSATAYTSDDLAVLIQQSLRKHSEDGKTLFRVLPKNVHMRENPFQGGAWYYVDIVAADAEMPIHRYGPLFGEVEEELEQHHGLNILLVPMVVHE
ncbi:MAG: hypothetical protein AAGI68_12005 [Planctomycetota bacterium]